MLQLVLGMDQLPNLISDNGSLAPIFIKITIIWVSAEAVAATLIIPFSKWMSQHSARHVPYARLFHTFYNTIPLASCYYILPMNLKIKAGFQSRCLRPKNRNIHDDDYTSFTWLHTHSLWIYTAQICHISLPKRVTFIITYRSTWKANDDYLELIWSSYKMWRFLINFFFLGKQRYKQAFFICYFYLPNASTDQNYWDGLKPGLRTQGRWQRLNGLSLLTPISVH